LVQLFRGALPAASRRLARKGDEEKGGCGTGFVAALPQAAAESVVEASDDARIIGQVEAGDGTVAVRGLEL